MASLNDSELLQLMGISLSNNGQYILQDIHLNINEGEIIGLVGKVGAGKTSLAKIICGLEKQTAGTVKFEDTEISKIKPVNYYRNVTMVFQFPEKQIFEETVFREISFALKNFGYPDEEIKKRVNHYIERIGLDSSLLDRPPLFLSGGELRKVALLSSIVIEPKLFILDEPFAWLDAHSAPLLKEVILSMRERGCSIIIIGHGVDDFEEICTRICHLLHGKLIYDDNSIGYLNFLKKNEY